MLRTRKVLSALAAAAVLSTSAFAGVGATGYNAPVASAQVEEPATPQAGIPATGNLQIHKLIGDEVADQPATGEEMTGIPGEAAPGIDFSVYRVNGADGQPIDLTDPAAWTEAAGLTVEQFFSGDVKNETNLIETHLGLVDAVATDAGGTATFSNLPAGVYLVVEKANQTTAEGQALAPSEPFLATVPMTNQAGTGWLDTVHVYPKNQVLEGAVKTVGEDTDDQPGSAVGENISYDITATIPATGQNGLGAFTFTDKLPAELGEPTNPTVTIGGTALQPGDFDAQTWETTTDGRWVLHVALTDTGLDKATANSDIVLSFDTEVLSTPSGTLDNQAWTSLTDPGYGVGDDPEATATAGAGVSSNAARSIYGQINITKTGTEGVALPGAVFELHRCDADGTIVGAPIRVGGETAFTTGDQGTVSISGIHLANVSGTDAATLNDVGAGQGAQFCLEETQAPGDYSLLPAPVPVTFEYDENTVNLVNVDQPISNVGANAGFELPLTGGNGFWLIVGAGVVLLVVAGGYYIIARKRSESTN